MRSPFTFASTLAAALLVAGSAFAADLDFTTSEHSGANGDTSYGFTASDGVDITVTAAPAPGATISWESGDGFGVRSTSGYEWDEIESAERLTVSFGGESVLLTDVYITDLFRERNNGLTFNETGYYRIDSGSWVAFSADPTQVTGTNGELTLSIDQYASSISFRAPGVDSYGRGREFSLAGLSYTASGGTQVPELDLGAAGSALTLLLGCVALAMERKRTASV